MSDPAAARAFLLSEIDSLEPFDFVALVPGGRPLHMVEVTRSEAGGLEVRVPGRPRSVPELEAGVRSALRERRFASEDPADPGEAWVRGVGDREEAADLVFRLLAEVFGEKADVPLDVGHGSHRAAHEAKKKLAAARHRIEIIVAEILGERAEQDHDGDYVLPIGDVHVMIAPRATPDAQVVVRVFAITNVGVTVSPELGLFLARMNFGLMFGRFALDVEHQSIWFDETLIGERFREEELRFAVQTVSATADAWDDRLQQMFGGTTYQQVLAGRTIETPPPKKPGEGIGQYL